MLFDRSLRRELSTTFGATLVVILTIVLTMMLIRTLGLAAGGSFDPRDVLLMLGFVTLAHLPTMMALSLFVAVVVTLGRMYRDSEMAIWFASGVGLHRFARPVLGMAAPVLLAIALLLAFAWPWVNRASADLRARYEQRSDLSRVAPGAYQSSRDGRTVFYIDRHRAGSGEAQNVFVLRRERDRETLITAQAGKLAATPDGQVLTLRQGQRNEVDRRSGTRAMASFAVLDWRVSEQARRTVSDLPPNATPTATLLASRDPRQRAELAWRFGLAWAALNLVLLGIGLAATPARRASNWNLLVALLSFIIYFNLISVSQARVALGAMPLTLALVALHGSVMAAALLLLKARMAVPGSGWRALLPAPRRRAPGAAA